MVGSVPVVVFIIVTIFFPHHIRCLNNNFLDGKKLHFDKFLIWSVSHSVTVLVCSFVGYGEPPHNCGLAFSYCLKNLPICCSCAQAKAITVSL